MNVPDPPLHRLEPVRHYYEGRLREILASYRNGVQAYTILTGGQGDIDIVVLDRMVRKPIAAYEVKLGECGEGNVEGSKSGLSG